MDEDQERQHAEELIRELSLPPEIERVEVKAGVDWTGDPALKVTLWVTPTLVFNQDKANTLNKAAQDVQVKLLESSLSRYPFVTLDQAA